MQQGADPMNYNLGSPPELSISFDALKTDPGLYGPLVLSAGGHPLGRMGEETFLFPVLSMCEELLSFAKRSHERDLHITSIEFLLGYDLWVRGAGDRILLHWTGPNSLAVETSISYEETARTVAGLRTLIQSA